MYLQTQGRLAGLLGDARSRTTSGRTRPTASAKPSLRPTQAWGPAKTTRSARRSSSGRTGRSPTSARTWPTSSGSSACSGRDFHYRLFADGADGQPLWATSTRGRQRTRPAARRSAQRAPVYNVIDVRQSYLQKLLKQALAAIGHTGEAERSVPLLVRDGGAVAQHRAAAGLRAVGRGRRAAVRRGVGPQGPRREGRRPARHRSIRKAGEEVASAANPDLDGRPSRGGSPRRSAIAAVRYFMIRFSRGKVIAFDIDEALSFEGESGPVPAVCCRPREQHLPEAAGTARASAKRSSCATPRRDVATVELTGEARRRTTSGRWCSRPRGSTRSPSRRSGRSSSRCWPSGRSAWRSCSTRSTTGTRS